MQILLVLYGQPRLTGTFWGIRRTIWLLRKRHSLWVTGALWKDNDLQPNVSLPEAAAFFVDYPQTVSSDSESIAKLFPALTKLPNNLMFQGLSFSKSLAKASKQIRRHPQKFDIVFVTRTDLYIPRPLKVLDIALEQISNSTSRVVHSNFHHDGVDDNLLFISPERVNSLLETLRTSRTDFSAVRTGEELREQVLTASNSSIVGATLPYHIGRNNSPKVLVEIFVDACLFALRRSLPRRWFDALTSPRVTLMRLVKKKKR